MARKVGKRAASSLSPRSRMSPTVIAPRGNFTARSFRRAARSATSPQREQGEQKSPQRKQGKSPCLRCGLGRRPLLDLEQLDLEGQLGVGRDDAAAGAPLAVAQ